MGRFTSFCINLEILWVRSWFLTLKTTNSHGSASAGSVRVPEDLLSPVGSQAPCQVCAEQTDRGMGKPGRMENLVLSHPSPAQHPFRHLFSSVLLGKGMTPKKGKKNTWSYLNPFKVTRLLEISLEKICRGLLWFAIWGKCGKRVFASSERIMLPGRLGLCHFWF